MWERVSPGRTVTVLVAVGAAGREAAVPDRPEAAFAGAVEAAPLPGICSRWPAWMMRGLLSRLALTIASTVVLWRSAMWDSVSPGRTVTVVPPELAAAALPAPEELFVGALPLPAAAAFPAGALRGTSITSPARIHRPPWDRPLRWTRALTVVL